MSQSINKNPKCLYYLLKQESMSSSTSKSYETNISSEENPKSTKDTIEKSSSAGHYSAKCLYCASKWARSEPQKLEAHLALECAY
ncbi:22475_t:CDS:2, partial [Racocetra persica]